MNSMERTEVSIELDPQRPLGADIM
jgi:TetR/AcrR family transcriptional regulator, transcriptional repressor for nem operon